MTIYGKGIFPGGLELKLVGSSEKPVDPNPNTIWIKTEAVIDRVCVGPGWQFNDKQVGDIWVDTSSQYDGQNDGAVNATTHLLTLSSLPRVLINMLQVNRWDGSGWNRCEGAIFANNSWTNMAMYLFRYGTCNGAYPLVCGTAQSSSALMELGDQPVAGSDHMVVKGNTSAVYGVVTTPDMTGIEVAGFSSMGIGYRVVSGSLSSGRMYCGLSSAVYTKVSYNNADDILSAQMTAEYELQEVSLPITQGGVLRPTIKFQSSSASPLELAVYYWVLT